MRHLFLILMLFIFIVAFVSEEREEKVSSKDDTLQTSVLDAMTPVYVDLDSIKTRGKLIALSRYNTTSFFIHRGQPMGYEYDLLKLFADEIGVELEIKTPSTWDSLYTMLQNGEGDVIAANLAITIDDAKRVSFSNHHSTTRQVLVQRKPNGWKKMKLHQIENNLIKSPVELIGKKVTVRKGSTYERRMKNLIEEVGGGVALDLVKSDIATEQLIRLVSDGIIDYTVANENVAYLNAAYYQNIDVKTPVGFPQRIAWAFRKSSPELREAVNSWIRKMRSNGDPTYYVIYNRYYRNRKDFKNRLKSDHFLLETGQISEYDSLFQKYQTEKFPWTLLAAQAYQESRFNPNLESRFGAIGLMQLLPTTAEMMRVKNPESPENSVKAGVRYMEYLYENHWSHLPDSIAIMFTLASYNAGPGHVFDAQRLADKYKRDRNLWFGNVEEMIVKLSHKKYIYMPEVKYGFCQGEEPKNYVREILERQKLYEKTIQEAARRRDKKENGDSIEIVEETVVSDTES